MPGGTQRDSRFLSSEAASEGSCGSWCCEVLRGSNSGGDQGYEGQGEASYVAVIRALWTERVNSRLLTSKQSSGAHLRCAQLKTVVRTSAGSHRGRRGTVSETRVDSPLPGILYLSFD